MASFVVPCLVAGLLPLYLLATKGDFITHFRCRQDYYLVIRLLPMPNRPVSNFGGCCFSSSLPNLTISPPSLIASTARPSDCNSLTRTRNDAGMLGSSIGSPLTIASYVLTRPWTSSDFSVSISCRV